MSNNLLPLLFMQLLQTLFLLFKQALLLSDTLRKALPAAVCPGQCCTGIFQLFQQGRGNALQLPIIFLCLPLTIRLFFINAPQLQAAAAAPAFFINTQITGWCIQALQKFNAWHNSCQVIDILLVSN